MCQWYPVPAGFYDVLKKEKDKIFMHFDTCSAFTKDAMLW